MLSAGTRAERAKAALPETLTQAQAQLAAVTDFFASRHGLVGDEAYRRLSRAEGCLRYALSVQTSDPVSALRAARKAETSAHQAVRLAPAEMNDSTNRGGLYGSPWNGGGRGILGPGSSYDSGTGGFARGVEGGILGGLLGSILFDGDREGPHRPDNNEATFADRDHQDYIGDPAGWDDGGFGSSSEGWADGDTGGSGSF